MKSNEKNVTIPVGEDALLINTGTAVLERCDLQWR